MVLIVGTASAVLRRPPNRDGNAAIVRQYSDLSPDGAYEYGFETDNGIQVEESGVGGQSVQGSAKWTDNDGNHFELSYIADENGYQPVGAHIPTPPPIPDYILRSIAYNAAHPQVDGNEFKQRKPEPEFQAVIRPTTKAPSVSQRKQATRFPSFQQQGPLPKAQPGRQPIRSRFF